MRKPNQGARGSLTIEAALVLPVFIYVIIAFAYFLQIIRIQETLQYAITETGFYTAKYAYVYDSIKEFDKKEEQNKVEANNKIEDNKAKKQNNNLEETAKDNIQDEQTENTNNNLKTSLETVITKSIDSAYYKIKMQDYLDKNKIDRFCIMDGFDGIHTYLSSFMKEEDSIDIILSYHIKLPLLFISTKEIPVMQRVRMHGWNGHKVAVKNSPPADAETGDGKMVYITENGTVYHLFKDCTYLDLSIHEVDYGQIETLRNDSGGKYKKCSICGDNKNIGGSLYITDFGDRYHYDLNCSGLKRTVITFPLSEVGSRRLCTRCRAREEK